MEVNDNYCGNDIAPSFAPIDTPSPLVKLTAIAKSLIATLIVMAASFSMLIHMRCSLFILANAASAANVSTPPTREIIAKELPRECTIMYSETSIDLRSSVQRQADIMSFAQNYEHYVQTGSISQSQASEAIQQYTSENDQPTAAVPQIVTISSNGSRFLYVSRGDAGVHTVLYDGERTIDHYSAPSGMSVTKGGTTNVFNGLVFSPFADAPFPGVGILGIPMFTAAGPLEIGNDGIRYFDAKVPLGSSGGSHSVVGLVPGEVNVEFNGSDAQVREIVVKYRTTWIEDERYPSYVMIDGCPIARRIEIIKYESNNTDLQHLTSVPETKTIYNLVKASPSSLAPSLFQPSGIIAAGEPINDETGKNSVSYVFDPSGGDMGTQETRQKLIVSSMLSDARNGQLDSSSKIGLYAMGAVIFGLATWFYVRRRVVRT